jgi:hypothetical protein
MFDGSGGGGSMMLTRSAAIKHLPEEIQKTISLREKITQETFYNMFKAIQVTPDMSLKNEIAVLSPRPVKDNHIDLLYIRVRLRIEGRIKENNGVLTGKSKLSSCFGIHFIINHVFNMTEKHGRMSVNKFIDLGDDLDMERLIWNFAILELLALGAETIKIDQKYKAFTYSSDFNEYM